MNCPNCNTPVMVGAAFCDNCGAPLGQPGANVIPPTAQAVICPSCGNAGATGQAFCDNCGAQLGGPAVNVQKQPPPYQQQQPYQQPQQPPPVYPPQQPYQQPQQPPPVYPPQQPYQQPQQPPPVYPPQQPYQQPQQPPPVYPQQQPYQQQPAGYPPQPPVQPPYQPPGYPPQQPVMTSPPRLLVQASNISIPFPMGKPQVIAGREDPISNVFPDVNMDPHGGDEGGISRQHARFYLQGTQWFIEDLDSTNFTRVNNQRILPKQPHLLSNGDQIQLGRVKLTFFLS